MAKAKGSPKTGGRKKGVTNKRTRETRDRIDRVLTILDETIEDDIRALSPRDRAFLMRDLQEFVRPKLARTELKHEGEMTVKQITGMEVK